MKIDNKVATINLTRVNVIDVKSNPNIISDFYGVTIRNCVPRPGVNTPERPPRAKATPSPQPWTTTEESQVKLYLCKFIGII